MNPPLNPTPSDDDLMRAFAAGDARAFDQLYARHQSPLYRFVRRLLGSACPGQVDEVFQDTWTRVIQHRQQWQPQGAAFRTWLFTLAHHRAIDCLRKSGREVAVPDATMAEPWEPEGPAWLAWPAALDPSAASATEPAEQAYWRAAGQRLLGCLDALPAAQRAVFLLHHEDGLALDELATALQLGYETAKSRLRYAMGKLRQCMGAYLDNAADREAPAGPRPETP